MFIKLNNTTPLTVLSAPQQPLQGVRAGLEGPGDGRHKTGVAPDSKKLTLTSDTKITGGMLAGMLAYLFLQD